MFRTSILTATSVLAFTVASHAADIYQGPAGVGGLKDGPYEPVATWSGFYIGVNGGGAWSDKTTGSSIHDVDTFIPSSQNVSVKGVEPSGGFGGGQLGYNVQGVFHPHIVLGFETDIQGAGIDDKNTSNFAGTSAPYTLYPYNYAAKQELDWFGTVRGRLGYAFDRTLIYATGGFAYGNVKYSGAATFTANRPGARAGDPAFAFSRDNIDTGYVVGGGIEHKFNSSWSIKAEYQYINLGSDNLHDVYFAFPGYSNNVKVENDYHTVRVGLNYHVGSNYEPLK